MHSSCPLAAPSAALAAFLQLATSRSALARPASIACMKTRHWFAQPAVRGVLASVVGAILSLTASAASAEEPLKLADSQLEPIKWADVVGWKADDHLAAFAAYDTSCQALRKIQRTDRGQISKALSNACRKAMGLRQPDLNTARTFFEQNFQPVRIARLGETQGFLTGYYEPIVQGSRFPNPEFHVPLYRRPPDLLEDGTPLRINYDSHNGYSFTSISRALIQRNLIPREEMSMQRVREWMAAHPDEAAKVRAANRSYVFFRITGLSNEGEPVGAQGVPLTPGRSIAVDQLHEYGTPFFIEANLPIASAKPASSFRRLMIAQDTGSAIVGPARADLYWGSGDEAARIAGRIRHPGRFVMLLPRELDMIEAGKHMPLPVPKPNVTELAEEQEQGKRDS